MIKIKNKELKKPIFQGGNVELPYKNNNLHI